MIEILSKIQCELKAPKTQTNKAGGYSYRSCEDILEAVKPLLEKYSVALTISDEIMLVGDRFYVKATATLRGKDGEINASAYARETEVKLNKYGGEILDRAQITGSASSYARKYALNGLFAIDDTKDADATNTHDDEPKQPQKREPKQELLKPEELAELSELCEIAGVAPNTVAARFKVSELRYAPYEKAKSALMATIDKNKQSA